MSIKIGAKSFPKSRPDPKLVPKPPRTRFFRFFIDFWSPRGFPKSSQNHEKSRKSDEKSMSRKHMAFNTIFCSISHGFGLRKRLQNRCFFAFVSKTLIFWKLAKTIEKTMVFVDFSRSESPEIDEKSMPKRIRKKHRKKWSKHRFWRPRLAPKTFENRSNITKNRSSKRCGTTPVSRRYANRAQIGAK